jgi:hypothetical protein
VVRARRRGGGGGRERERGGDRKTEMGDTTPRGLPSPPHCVSHTSLMVSSDSGTSNMSLVGSTHMFGSFCPI